MADIGNQLGDVEGGLERFLDALDDASIKMSSNASLQARLSKISAKTQAASQKLDVKKLKEQKAQFKLFQDLNKTVKALSASMVSFSKKAMGGAMGGMKKLAGAAAKGGAIGGLVIGVKFLIDGLLKVDKAMASLSKQTFMARSQLEGVKEAAIGTQKELMEWGITLEQAAAEGANLVEAFGSARYVTKQLITDSILLQKGFGVAAGAAGELTEALERSQRSGEAFKASIEAIAGKAGVSASLVMREMASRSQQIAIQNERSTDAMAKMVAQSLKVGVSYKDFEGMKAAFSDIDNIANTMADATAVFGPKFAQIMGTQEELHILNMKGKTGQAEILRRYEVAMKATTTEMKDGTIIVDHMQQAYGELEGLVERVATGFGVANEAQAQLARSVKEMTADEAEAAKKQKQYMDALKGGMEFLEMLGNTVKMVFETLSTTFSKAVGLDSDEPGSIRDQVFQLTGWIKEQLSLDELAEKTTAGSGPAKFFDNLIEITLKPMFKKLGTYLMEGLVSAFQQYDFNLIGGILGTSDYITESAESIHLKEITKQQDKEAIERQALTEKNTAAYFAQLNKHRLPTSPTGKALGGFGGLSVLGEGGAGEVVMSRSALRRGIKVGGRAGAALAGIGVPGYREGYAEYSAAGIHGQQGLQGAAGSQAMRGARAKAFQAEQARQQASMMEYWRQHYEDKMEGMIDEKAKRDKKGPNWLKLAFKEYNQELAFVLNKELGPNVATGLMTGMTEWANGGDLADAINAGARAGILAGINDPGSQLNTLLKKTGEFQSTLTAGLASFAAGGSGKDMLRSMAVPGTQALAGKLFGSRSTGYAAEYMGMGGMQMAGPGGMPSGRQASHMGLRHMIGMPQAATGKYVNSPTLMMVGEGGAGEVVIPTERIRKGLPINAGVARELGSIGVPGFHLGVAGHTHGGGLTSGNYQAPGMKKGVFDSSTNIMGQKISGGIKGGTIGNTDIASLAVPEGGAFDLAAASSGPLKGLSANVGEQSKFGQMGGLGGMAKAGGAGALMNFGSVYAQTGDWKQAGTAGIGSGIGVAAGMGLTAMGIPPPLSGMIGGMIGGLATQGLNSVFNLTGGYGKGRRKVIKKLESHIKTGGRFDFGAPGGLAKSMGQAIGGHERTPTEANFQKLVEKLGTSRLIASMGVPAPALVALGMGQMDGSAARKMYGAINTSLYGKGGSDKYRRALAVPSLAAGGIVNRPTTALIGERGPEAVVPLGDSEMMKELKKQNKLMLEMIKTQKETAQTEIRMDGRIVAETVGQNMYDIGTGL